MKWSQAAILLLASSAVQAFVSPRSIAARKPALVNVNHVASSYQPEAQQARIRQKYPYRYRTNIFASTNTNGENDDDEKVFNPYADPNYPDVSKPTFNSFFAYLSYLLYHDHDEYEYDEYVFIHIHIANTFFFQSSNS